jgi:hypothetical protein
VSEVKRLQETEDEGDIGFELLFHYPAQRGKLHL